MKKVSLLSFLFIAFSSVAFAQENEFSKKHEHQVAINATNFIQTLISFNGSTFNNTPYNFQYKYLNWQEEKKYAIGARAGYGYTKAHFNTDQPNSNSTSKSESTFLDTRIGAEFHYKLGKRWHFFAGLDFVYGKTIMNSTSTFKDFNNQVVTSETKDWRERSGFGPVIGAQFNFSKRLALGTELTLYSINEIMTRRSGSSNSPQFNQVMYSKSGNTSVQVPSFIYFIVRL